MVKDVADKAARSVPAHFDFAAVLIENPILEIHSGHLRGFHKQNLICSDPKVPIGKKANIFFGKPDGLCNPVNDDKVVAGSLHFCEL
jgi:hypothetical protein